MARLEDLMGLFGDLAAPAADDPRRRRAPGGRGLGGYEGIGGADVGVQQVLPYLQGLQAYDYSGPQGGGGLAGLFSGAIGPAARHFQRQGGQLPPGLADRGELPPGLAQQDQLPPGLDSRGFPGGPNVAPGNVDTGRAFGQPPGQYGASAPHTQGWRNFAPGYGGAAALGYGTPEFDNRVHGLAGGVDAGPGRQEGPGARGADTGGAGQGKGVSGVPGGGQPAPGPLEGGGGGRQASGGGGGGGGGRPAPVKVGKSPGARPGNATAKQQNAADKATVKAGTASKGTNVRPGQVANTNPKGGTKGINKQTGGPQTNAGQAVVFGPGPNGPIVQVAGNGANSGGKGVVQNGPPPHATAPPPPAGKTKPKTGSVQKGGWQTGGGY